MTTTTGEWMKFKRKSDNVKVDARLVQTNAGRRMMQIREPRGTDLVCPACSAMLTQGNARLVPDFLLEPVIFHERHNEYGRPRK